MWSSVKSNLCTFSLHTYVNMPIHPFLLFFIGGCEEWGLLACLLFSPLCSKSPLLPFSGTYQSSSFFHVSLASSSFKHSLASHIVKTIEDHSHLPWPHTSLQPPSSALLLFLAKSIEKHSKFTVFTPSYRSENIWRESDCLNGWLDNWLTDQAGLTSWSNNWLSRRQSRLKEWIC